MRKLIVLFALIASSHAAEVLHETFDAPELPKNWTTGGRKGSWTIVDGTLQGNCSPDDDHGPAVFVPLSMKNVKVIYKLKREPGAYALMLIDGTSVFGGEAHLLRVAVNNNSLTIAQDRGSPKSKLDQAKAKAEAKKAGQEYPKPTPAQLSDPWFYRTESLATAKLSSKPGEWLKIEVIVHGNSVAVTLNDKQLVTAKSTVLDVQKSRLVFLAGAGKKLWLDDVSVEEPK